MHQQHKMEIKFDGILKQAMPLILFSYERHRKPLLDKVSRLYAAFVSMDTTIFDELFSQISDIIENREETDTYNERLIESFINRNRTYGERLLDHDNELRKLRKQISSLKGKSIKRIPVKKSTPRILANPKCPNCGRILYRYGKTDDGRQRYYCSHRKNGCGTVFTLDKEGKLKQGST